MRYTGVMKTNEEKRWERVREHLLSEASGNAPARFSSQRTLFGIKSHVESVIEAAAEEENAKCEDALRRGKGDGPAAKSQGQGSDGLGC